jgi:hypothetical protein
MQKLVYDAFQAILSIEYAIPATPQSPHISIRLYDLRGREVAVMIDKTVGTGYHVATYSFREHSSGPLSTGTYICLMNAPGYRSSHTVCLVKQ